MNAKGLKKLWTLVALVALAGGAAAQNGDDANQYRVEYEAYQQVLKEADPSAKAAGLLGFVKKFPKSSLVEYALPEYKKIIGEFHKAGKVRETVSMADSLLAIRPNDLAGFYYASDILFRNQKYKESIPYAERLQSLKDANAETKKRALYMLSFSAVQIGDKAMLRKYGPASIDAFGTKETYAIIVDLMKTEFAENNLSRAAQYAAKAVEGLKAVERTNSGNEWRSYIKGNLSTAYAIMGHSSFEKQRWTSAISNYNQVLTLAADKKDLVGEAHYKIGMSLWRQGKIEPDAMEAFAKGANRGRGQHASACQKYLEELYKSRHNGSLAGLEEFVENALRKS